MTRNQKMTQNAVLLTFAFCSIGAQSSTAFTRHAQNATPASANFVTGHSWITSRAYSIDASLDCYKSVMDLSSKLVDEDLFKKQFNYDYSIACIPDGDSSQLFVEVQVEPASPQDISALNDYITAHQDTTWSTITFHFSPVEKIEIQKEVTAQFLKNHDRNHVAFQYELGGRPNDHTRVEFDSFGAFRAHVDNEIAAFHFAQSTTDVLAYLSKYYAPESIEDFKGHGLVKANFISTSNRHRVILSQTHESLEGTYSNGTFRECFNFGSEMCLDPALNP